MQRYQRAIRQLCKRSTILKPNPACTVKYFSSDNNENNNEENEVSKIGEEKKVELSGFAKAFEKFAAPEPVKPEEIQSFAHLVRYSKFVDLGDPEGKMVVGKIFHIVDNDLYIDFGWKFYCVCQKPVSNAGSYVRGATVRLRIKDLELSTKFLGASKDLTILEADCTLHGLISTPMKKDTYI